VSHRELADPVAWERALLPLSRRRFLALIGALGASGLVPASCGSGEPNLPEELIASLRAFSPRSYRVFNAVAQRFVGEPGAALIRDRRVDPARTSDAWLARTPALGKRLHQALLLLEFGIHPLVAKLRPFTSLDGPTQDAVLDDLMRSSLDLKRDLFKGFKSSIFLAFYSDPETRALVSYPGPFGGGQFSIQDAMIYQLESDA
jgi:hypothetical protein